MNVPYELNLRFIVKGIILNEVFLVSWDQWYILSQEISMSERNQLIPKSSDLELAFETYFEILRLENLRYKGIMLKRLELFGQS